ncbi:MAG: hypothetical protein DRO52_02750 [Candidatus Hecatellales archaeon]|nr:MAG: hypothetical protein DRO52_02750 [Candidatus Hecatellales archaeon]
MEASTLEPLGTLLMQLGFGGGIGFVIGFALKKLLKIILVLLGIYFVSLFYLAHEGFITINYEKFSELYEALTEKLLHGGFTVPAFLTSHLPFAGAFILGLGLGFKVG